MQFHYHKNLYHQYKLCFNLFSSAVHYLYTTTKCWFTPHHHITVTQHLINCALISNYTILQAGMTPHGFYIQKLEITAPVLDKVAVMDTRSLGEKWSCRWIPNSLQRTERWPTFKYRHLLWEGDMIQLCWKGVSTDIPLKRPSEFMWWSSHTLLGLLK